jgi:hypothetical protein
VPYLLLGLQDVQWAVGNSRGARKLARTPHVNQKKKKKKEKRKKELQWSVSNAHLCQVFDSTFCLAFCGKFYCSQCSSDV